VPDPAAFVTVAERLRRASGREPVASVHADIDGGMAGAYVIQAINRQQWLAENRGLAGYKVAFTTKESQELFGTNEPVYGTLFKDMRFESGGTIPSGILAAPKVEGEIVFELGTDITSDDLDPQTIRAAIAAIYPALEIPDSPINGKLTAVDMAAANAAAAAYVLGKRHPVDSSFDFAGIKLTMKHNDAAVSSGLGSVCMGDPVNVLIWLAQTLVGSGIPMRRGQIVFTGSLVPIISAAPGDTFEADAGELGTVGIRFAA